VDTDEAFKSFADKTGTPTELLYGMRKAWATLSSSDRTFIGQLKKITITDREGVLGLAHLHSHEIALQHKSLVRLGDLPMYYGAVVIHEAMHAIKGFGEHEATRAEQRYTGKLYGEGVFELDRAMMFETFKAAAIGQSQREVDVERRHRKDDFRFLNSVGYTTRVARKILAVGARISKNMQSQDGYERRHQYMHEAFHSEDGTINKTITREMGLILKSLTGDSDEILKTGRFTLSSKPYFDLSEAGVVTNVQLDMLEKNVSISHDRGIGLDVRGPFGMVPKLRRVGGDISKLSSVDNEMRMSAIRELIPDVAEHGLFREDGQPTDSHVLMTMHGFSPSRKNEDEQ
jgi:hypothetical protein